MNRWSAGWTLMLGSPLVMAAVSVSLGMLEDQGLIAFRPKSEPYVGMGNLALAVLGTVAGAVILPVAPIYRFCFALGFGFLSALAYMIAFIVGANMFLRIDL